jgi:hypothetical protein
MTTWEEKMGDMYGALDKESAYVIHLLSDEQELIDLAQTSLPLLLGRIRAIERLIKAWKASIKERIDTDQ